MPEPIIVQLIVAAQRISAKTVAIRKQTIALATTVIYGLGVLPLVSFH